MRRRGKFFISLKELWECVKSSDKLPDQMWQSDGFITIHFPPSHFPSYFNVINRSDLIIVRLFSFKSTRVTFWTHIAIRYQFQNFIRERMLYWTNALPDKRNRQDTNTKNVALNRWRSARTSCQKRIQSFDDNTWSKVSKKSSNGQSIFQTWSFQWLCIWELIKTVTVQKDTVVMNSGECLIFQSTKFRRSWTK